MAPDETLFRDQEPERGMPVLIDEMLQRHRRRADGMVDIMHALGRRRIDAERMRLRPVLAGLDDRALSHRRGEPAFERNARQLRRLVDRDLDADAGFGQHFCSQATAQILPRRADGLAPEGVERPAQANEPCVFDAVGSRRGRPAVPQERVLCWGRAKTRGRHAHAACPMPQRTPADKAGPASGRTKLGPSRRFPGDFQVAARRPSRGELRSRLECRQ